MENKFEYKKFDIKTENNTIIRGAIFTEKPSFNYTESLKLKNKSEEIKKLKKLKNEICLKLRINKQDISVDEKKYRLWTSRRIIIRRQLEIKEMNLIPAIIEITAEENELEIEIEFI